MPVNSTHWSTRLMAERISSSKDPQFVEKVQDIVGL
jgi:hypothetical protein